jgi:hypothetical protein
MAQSPKSVSAITLFVEDLARSKDSYERVFQVTGVVEADAGTVILEFDNLFLRLLTRTTYRRLLTKLVTRKCKETQLRLANELANTRHILAHDGHGHYSYLRLMRLLDGSIPNSIRYRQRCADVSLRWSS